jgi:5-methylcytosine-specific restriction endonuclease McrA
LRVEPIYRDVCGTDRGHQRHTNYKEYPCGPCRAAHAARQREYYAKNAHKERERFKKNKTDPDYNAAHNAAKRAHRGKKSQTKTEPYTIVQVLELYGEHCHICKEAIDLEAPRQSRLGDLWENGLHLDHVVPISKGGTDTIDNIRPAHAQCNLRKSARHNEIRTIDPEETEHFAL